jgi:hypothetical protein
MKSIRMSDCEFYVNEEKRTVICKIPAYWMHTDGEEACTRDMVLEFIRDECKFSDIDIGFAIGWKFEEQLQMPRYFIGKAVCAEEDEWNEDTGKLIAFHRAKDKCYKAFFKRANLVVQTMDRRLGDMITTFNRFGKQLQNGHLGMQQRIDEITGVINEEV